MAPEAAPRVSSLSKTAGETLCAVARPSASAGPAVPGPLSSLQCRGVRAFCRRGAWVWRGSGSESGRDGFPVASRPRLPGWQQLAGPRAPRGPARGRRPRPRTSGRPGAAKSQDSASWSGADGGGMERGAGRSAAAAPPAQAAVARVGQQVGPLVPVPPPQLHRPQPRAPSPGLWRPAVLLA